ncbi:MAG TPA: hypothetical protein GX513_07770, partial [Firmicutes bacterium]|nr:hypothetical protein [Bacillota bacterium]
RRSLYRLKAAGVKIPPIREQVATSGPHRALMSWVDGMGRRLTMVFTDRPSGGLRMAKVVVGDDGLFEPVVSELSPGQWRRLQAALEQEGIHLVPFPLEYVQGLLAQAYGKRVPEDPQERAALEAALRAAGVAAAAAADSQADEAVTGSASAEHPVYGVLNALAIKWDPSLLPDSPRLLEEPEMRGWVPPADLVRKWVKQLQDMAASPLVLDEGTRRARGQGILREAVAELFPPEKVPSWRRRLEDISYYFCQRKAETSARLALAAALALAPDSKVPVEEHPLLQGMVARALRGSVQEEMNRPDRPRIVVPGGVGGMSDVTGGGQGPPGV